MRERHLRDVNAGQSWISRCEERRVFIRSGRPGKERDVEKVFDDANAAQRHAEKEELARLRKGWILSDPGAVAGQPRMHRLLRGSHTGAMAIDAIAEDLLCNRFGSEDRDNLYVIGADGRLIDTIEAPQNRLIWNAKHVPDAGIVLLQADHQIIAYSLEQREFKTLTPMNPTPASYLSTSGTLASWYVEPNVVICDLTNGRTIFRQTVSSQKYGGHSPQMCAELSADGATLACCSQSGVITLFDVATGQVRGLIESGFQMIAKMAFITNSQRLVAQEVYGNWLLRCFNLSDLRETPDWPRIDVESGHFAIDQAGQRLAVAHGKRLELYQLPTMRRLLRFEAEHAVKRCALAFAGTYLGVLTDLGCASLYALD